MADNEDLIRRPNRLTVDLQVACLLDDSNKVIELLAMGADKDAKSATGTSALDIADFLNHTNSVKSLMSNLDIEQVGAYELLKAIRLGHATVVRALLEMGVRDQLQDDNFFRGVLLLSCCVSNAMVFSALVNHGPVMCISTYQHVYIQAATMAGHMEIVEAIRKIVDDERDILGNTEGYVVRQDFVAQENFTESENYIQPQNQIMNYETLVRDHNGNHTFPEYTIGWDPVFE